MMIISFCSSKFINHNLNVKNFMSIPLIKEHIFDTFIDQAIYTSYDTYEHIYIQQSYL